jgi:hypothetical protein
VRDAYPAAELEAILGLGEVECLEAEEHVLKAITEPMPLGEIIKAARRWATREETLRAIFCGLSCELLQSSRWHDFTAVPPLG